LDVTWTETQARRLKELDADQPDLNKRFANSTAREQAFQKLENKLVARQRQRLQEFREIHLRPALCRLESKLVDVMISRGFAQVTTPIIMSRGLLEKMSIDANHALSSQIYWLEKNKCLRPMLAPHLYYVLKDLLRLWDKPVRIFEVGPCFRKESQGAQHSSEFTMLNLVEMGLPVENRENSIDIVAGQDRLEVGSAAMGPHPLDRPWKITETWVGLGFGLERLLMAAENSRSLAKMGRSLAYLDGIRLNI
jgi:phenylalanyl-tRNA synthetase alpha chain